ncbi:MAG TPA: carbamoyl-phosphate synthase large subunit, partial [Cupriavidus sp.]|nr:carbamoyl-phosphate synthase large subunit [Cupriavidus sp.]
GGGRPGDVDFPTVAGLYQPSFAAFAALSGEVPVIGIAAGRCFAGNAALLGCSDVIIATRDANIGMAGPAMIEGGGLGVYRPEDIGPAAVQYQNGVVDLLVDDEAEAVRAAKHYLSMFQGR